MNRMPAPIGPLALAVRRLRDGGRQVWILAAGLGLLLGAGLVLLLL